MSALKRTVLLIIWAFCSISMAACSVSETVVPSPTPTPGVTLTPFLPTAAAPDATETPRPIASPTPPPTATPTPFLYAIVEGDTLIGVAFRYGITLPELLAANPGIDPQFLRIGDSLVIPLPENPGSAGTLPTPVAALVAVGSPECYPSGDGGLWCFALFENQGEVPLESIAAQISVYDPTSRLIATRTAISPVNLVPPGQNIPVSTFFPNAGESFSQAAVVLSSAIPLTAEDSRYLPVESSYDLFIEGDKAVVVGEITGVFNQARVAVTAYDADGKVVGVRVIQLSSEAGGQFSLEVFSLSGDIAQLSVLVEAYP